MLSYVYIRVWRGFLGSERCCLFLALSDGRKHFGVPALTCQQLRLIKFHYGDGLAAGRGAVRQATGPKPPPAVPGSPPLRRIISSCQALMRFRVRNLNR